MQYVGRLTLLVGEGKWKCRQRRVQESIGLYINVTAPNESYNTSSIVYQDGSIIKWNQEFEFTNIAIGSQLKVGLYAKFSAGRSSDNLIAKGSFLLSRDGDEVSLFLQSKSAEIILGLRAVFVGKSDYLMDVRRGSIRRSIVAASSESGSPLLESLAGLSNGLSGDGMDVGILSGMQEGDIIASGIVDYIILVGPKIRPGGRPRSKSVILSASNSKLEKHQFINSHDASVLYQYPKDKPDFPLPTKVEWFCFPIGLEIVEQVEMPKNKVYTFELVGGDTGTQKTYGICHISYSKKCLCCPDVCSKVNRWIPSCLAFITRLSNLPVLENCLIALHDLWTTTNNQDQLGEALLLLTSELPVPVPEVMGVGFQIGKQSFTMHLPSIHRLAHCVQPIHTMFSVVSIKCIIKMVVLGWCEYRIILHSSKLTLVHHVAAALRELVYPLEWMHPYVPILPHILGEYAQAPVPYILGIHSDSLHDIQPNVQDQTLIVDLDRGTMSGAEDGPPLPASTTYALQERIAKLVQPKRQGYDRFKSTSFKSTNFKMKELYGRIKLEFICYFASLLYGYKDCLFFITEEQPIFNKQRFYDSYAESEAIPVLTKIISTQAFECFLMQQNNVALNQFHFVYGSFRRGKSFSWPNCVPHVDFNKDEYECLYHSDLIKLPVFDANAEPTEVEAEQIGQAPKHNHRAISPFLGALRDFQFWTVQQVAAQTNISSVNLVQKLIDEPKKIDSANDTEKSAEVQQTEKCLKHCMAKIFESNCIEAKDIQECENTFDSSYARDLFVLILMQPTQRFTSKGDLQSHNKYSKNASGSFLGQQGFLNLVHLARTLLEKCRRFEDYGNARGLLQVSAQYYRCVDTNNLTQNSYAGKQYLVNYIKDQPICKSLSMWQHALSKELEPDDAARSGRSKHKSAVKVQSEVFFSHMGSLVYDMLTVNVPEGNIAEFVKIMCSTYAISSDVENTLATLVGNLNKAFMDSTTTTAEPPLEDSTMPSPKATTGAAKPYVLDDVIQRKMSIDSDADVERRISSNDDGLESTKGATIYGHKGPVLCVAASDRFIVSGAVDFAVRAVDMKKNFASKPLLGHTGPISAVLLLERTVVSASYDSTVRIWEIPGPKKVYNLFKASAINRELRGHSAPVSCIDIGNRVSSHKFNLTSGSMDNTIRLWSSTSEECKKVLYGHNAPIVALRYSTQQDRIISGSSDSTVKLWDVHREYAFTTLEGHYGRVNDVRTSGDRISSASDDRTVCIWDVRSGKRSHHLKGHHAPVNCVSFGGPTDPMVVSGAGDTDVRIWDLRKVKKHSSGSLLVLTNHSASVTCVRRDFSSILTASDDGTLRAWEVHTGKCSSINKAHVAGITCLSLSDTCAVSGSWDSTVHIWPTARDSS